jgi:uncharacterized protein YbjT (DUF2867 family)
VLGDAVPLVRADFARPASWPAALAGVDRLFLLRPPAIANARRYIYPVIDAARAAGVERIVFLSLLGAEKNPVVPHASVEKHLRRAGVPWTFLRPSFFMQNLSTTHRTDLEERDELYLPAGRGPHELYRRARRRRRGRVRAEGAGPRFSGLSPHRQRGAHLRPGGAHLQQRPGAADRLPESLAAGFCPADAGGTAIPGASSW